MRADLLELAADLARKGDAFAVAMVVRREPASSAQVGNAAIITEAGTFHGWLGGSCIQPTVRAQAVAAINDARPRLISLSPDPSGDERAGVTVFPMTCHSGGSVDIYIEPVLPAPRLLIFGVSPAAQSLARLGKVMGFAVDAVDPEADRATFPEAERIVTEFRADELQSRPASQRVRLFAVVATLGQRDEEATMNALAAEPAYLGVVASRKRFAQVKETLIARGLSPDALGRVTNPAGIDIGAKTPEEVALSIMAEIVRVRHEKDDERRHVPMSSSQDREERDPVCGMTVAPATARYTAEHGNRTYYFCCGGCRERFVAAPERYGEAFAS